MKPYSMAATEEVWVLASFPVFSCDLWFDKKQEHIVAQIMKNSGGRLCPEFVRSKVEEIFSERGLT